MHEGDRFDPALGARWPVCAPDAERAAGSQAAPYHAPMRLVDSHCHVNADRFERDADQVLGAARLAGVERILVPGWNLASSRRALDLVERLPWLDAAVGVHPHDAAKADDAAWAQIVAWAGDERVVAIGETGLDYDRVFSPIPDQLANLRRNLALAVETGKPAILHCRSAAGKRDAQDALFAELRDAGVGGAAWVAAFGDRPPVVIHSFSGPTDYARAMLDLGAAISFSGLVFRAGEEASAEVAAIVPVERLLVETDAPFLAPPGAPRSRNEPEYVRITAAWVAERRGVPAQAGGATLVEAYERTFPRTRSAG
jgi:TatD DNase family protein